MCSRRTKSRRSCAKPCSTRSRRSRRRSNKLAPLLTDDVMQNLNLQVDGPQKREPADVARDFLKQNDLG